MPVGFRGAVLSAPGVAAYIDDSQATSAASVTTRSVTIVGVAERGIPNTAVAISNASTARAVYGTGSTATPLVDGIIRALNAGAGLVYGIRTGRAKPFVTSLTKDGVEGIAVVTDEYGKFAKSWYLTVGPSTNTITQNSVSSGKKVSITIDSGTTYSVDNIGKSLVNIIGTSTLSGRCEVTADKINLQRSANETASFTIASAQTFAVGGGTGCTITVAGSGANAPIEEIMAKRADVAPIDNVAWPELNKKVPNLMVFPLGDDCFKSNEMSSKVGMAVDKKDTVFLDWLLAVHEEIKDKVAAEELKTLKGN